MHGSDADRRREMSDLRSNIMVYVTKEMRAKKDSCKLTRNSKDVLRPTFSSTSLTKSKFRKPKSSNRSV